MAFRGERARLAFGTPGGDQQDQWSLTSFARRVAQWQDLQRLIDLPMFHTEHLAGSFVPHPRSLGRLVVEERVGPAVVEALRLRGHDLDVAPAWSLGPLSAVEHDLEVGLLRAAANPRGMQGYAVGR